MATPLNDLLSVARRLPKNAVSELHAHSRSQIRLACNNRSVYEFPLHAGDDFPVLEHDGPLDRTGINAVALHQLLANVSHASDDSGVMPQLAGVHLAQVDDRARAVAANGHRLALFDIPGIRLNMPEDGVIVPNATVREIVRLSGESQLCSCNASGRSIRIDTDRETLIAKLIDGRYVAYENTLAPEISEQAITNRKELIDVVERASTVVGRHQGLILETRENQLDIGGEHELQKASEVVDILDGERREGFRISCNAQYLLDALKVCSGERVGIGFTFLDGPVAITSASDPGLKQVIMPMRV